MLTFTWDMRRVIWISGSGSWPVSWMKWSNQCLFLEGRLQRRCIQCKSMELIRSRTWPSTAACPHRAPQLLFAAAVFPTLRGYAFFFVKPLNKTKERWTWLQLVNTTTKDRESSMRRLPVLKSADRSAPTTLTICGIKIMYLEATHLGFTVDMVWRTFTCVRRYTVCNISQSLAIERQ